MILLKILQSLAKLGMSTSESESKFFFRRFNSRAYTAAKYIVYQENVAFKKYQRSPTSSYYYELFI